MIYFVIFVLLYPICSVLPLLVLEKIELEITSLNSFFKINFVVYLVIGTLVYINDIIKGS